LISAVFGLITVDVNTFDDSVACSHSAAIYFYIDSIKNFCKYAAYPCASKEDFDAGNCLKCYNGKTACNRMGYYSAMNKDRGLLYLNTQPPLSENFDHLCVQNYLVTLASTDANKLQQTRGSFKLYFETSSGLVSSTELIDDSTVTFKAGETQTRLVSLKEPLAQNVDSVHVSFTKTSNWASSWMYDNMWGFKYVEVLSGEKQDTWRFCPTQPLIESGKTVKFEKC
jgi:triacylglycerol lipase